MKSTFQAKGRRQGKRSSAKRRTFWTSTCVTWSHLQAEETVVGAAVAEEASFVVAREAVAADAETDTEDVAMASFVADSGAAAVDAVAARSTSRTRTPFPASAAHKPRLEQLNRDKPLLSYRISPIRTRQSKVCLPKHL